MAVEAVTVCEVTRGESGKVCWGTGDADEFKGTEDGKAVFQKKWKREELWEDGIDQSGSRRCPWLWGFGEAGGLAEEGPEGLPVGEGWRRRQRQRSPGQGPQPSGLDLLRPQKADYPAKPLELTFQIPNSASLSQGGLTPLT